MFNFICPDLSYSSLIIKLKGDKNMITNEEVSKIIYEEIKDELERKPLTKEEINNPLNKERKMHLWSSDTESSNTVIIACFHYLHKKLYAFEVDKKQFIECFKNALNDITDKIISVSGKDVKCSEVKL